MARFPEIRVTRKGFVVERVLYDPQRDGAPMYDITDWSAAVKVTFAARIVEVESDA